MSKTISIIGGDYRIIKLAEFLRKDGFKIKSFGLENFDEIQKEEKCENIEDCIKNSKTIISSIPFSKDGKNVYMPFSDKILNIEELFEKIQGKTLIAGNIPDYILNENKKIKNDVGGVDHGDPHIKNDKRLIEIYDLMKNEPLTIANAISTAEGAIQIAMEETDITIHNSKILILGFGRIGKILAKDLQALGAKVTCEARNDSDISWIKAYGYKSLDLNELGRVDGECSVLEKYDIIFNTIPHLILDKEKLEKVSKNCLIIDLASKPGGVDFEECDKLGIKNKWALALPGKVAPVTSAKYIKEEIYKIIN